MAVALAMLQIGSTSERELFIILGVIMLATLIALGLKFFVNIFEVLTAPGASMRHHGQNDNFFFSIFVVFLGGLIGTFGLLASKTVLSEEFTSYATQVCNDIAISNSNENYRAIAASWGLDTMVDNFVIFVLDNLIFFPVVMVSVWLIVGLVCFVGAKMFSGNCTAGNLLGSLAYSAFFASIGLGFVALIAMRAIAAGGGTPQIDVLGIIGAVLLLYALVLFFSGISSAAEIQAGQVAGVVIVLLIVFGGIGYGLYAMSTEPWEAFKLAIQSYNPSQGTY
jgi:hypothetical protein